ncbi:hypothetical protein [Kribbella sp. NBC_00359]|uniref:hypothetical protein n=1 Tax=Kribbella sp. NBC_00359 TaxID=2975966 RepID=UPI002E1A4BB0
MHPTATSALAAAHGTEVDAETVSVSAPVHPRPMMRPAPALATTALDSGTLPDSGQAPPSSDMGPLVQERVMAIDARLDSTQASGVRHQFPTEEMHYLVNGFQQSEMLSERRCAMAECVRRGRGWKVSYSGNSLVVGHVVGMLHLAVLIANPMREIPAIELAGGANALGASSARRTAGSQMLLDHEAIANYRRRLTELRAETDRLSALGDQQRAADLQAEFDWLVGELAAASGLSGRARNFTDNHERARIAVGKAIRRSITRIERVDQIVGQHLRESIYTGMRCVYLPA